MVCYHAKSLFRDLYAALCGKGPWFEAKYHFFALWSDLYHPIRCVVYGIRNLYAYFPLIWHDRDWDYSCMLDLWELKFQRMAHQHLVYGNHVGHVEMARQLRMCAQLCARIRDDNYAEADAEAHDKKWGESHHVFLPTGHGTSEWRTARLNVRNDRDKENERKEFMAYINKAEQQRANDLKLLGDTIATYCLHWWD